MCLTYLKDAALESKVCQLLPSRLLWSESVMQYIGRCEREVLGGKALGSQRSSSDDTLLNVTVVYGLVEMMLS